MSRWTAWLVVGCLLSACEDDDETAPVVGPPPIAEPACEGFELHGETARDVRTGLEWDRTVELSFSTAESADAVCAARGARLPTRQELLDLRAPSADDACQLPSCPFRGDRCATLQCGSSVPGTDARWGIAFSGGALVMVPAGQAEALVCVR